MIFFFKEGAVYIFMDKVMFLLLVMITLQIVFILIKS